MGTLLQLERHTSSSRTCYALSEVNLSFLYAFPSVPSTKCAEVLRRRQLSVSKHQKVAPTNTLNMFRIILFISVPPFIVSGLRYGVCLFLVFSYSGRCATFQARRERGLQPEVVRNAGVRGREKGGTWHPSMIPYYS